MNDASAPTFIGEEAAMLKSPSEMAERIWLTY